MDQQQSMKNKPSTPKDHLYMTSRPHSAAMKLPQLQSHRAACGIKGTQRKKVSANSTFCSADDTTFFYKSHLCYGLWTSRLSFNKINWYSWRGIIQTLKYSNPEETPKAVPIYPKAAWLFLSLLTELLKNSLYTVLKLCLSLSSLSGFAVLLATQKNERDSKEVMYWSWQHPIARLCISYQLFFTL